MHILVSKNRLARFGCLLMVSCCALQAKSALAEPACAEVLTDLLENLSTRHREEAVRLEAGKARPSVPSACDDAGSIVDAAVTLLAQLGDPAIRIIDNDHFQRTLDEWTGKSVVGVGLTEVLSIDVDEQTNRLTIIAPVPDSPAAVAGLRPGDVVMSIEGTATEPLGLSGSMRLLRVAAGQSVALTVQRGDAVRDVVLRATQLPPLEPVSGEVLGSGEFRILHLRLHQFIPGASDKLAGAMKAGRDIDAIVLDLRNNPGGLVTELQATAGLFLAAGTPIATARGAESEFIAVAAGAEPIDTPLAVLVDTGSASAAEALAGALRAHGRARLYGQRTFGKGLVHQTLPVVDAGVLMFPAAELETPDGHPILGAGIDPDVRTPIPLTTAGSDLSKSLSEVWQQD
jgi:carboxyl-terminal processing protease